MRTMPLKDPTHGPSVRHAACGGPPPQRVESEVTATPSPTTPETSTANKATGATATKVTGATATPGANALLGLLWITTCLLVGEAAAAWTRMPVPGAVLGVFLMLLCLVAIGRVPECIDLAATFLLRNLPLFVIPAGVSVMAHLGLLQADLVAVVAAIVVSTLTALAFTAWMARKAVRP